MKKLLFLIFLFPLCLNAQIYDHHRVFNDTLNYKDFNQGFIDSQVYFKGTGDYLIGLSGIYMYYVPTVICYSIPPNDKRLINSLNPNNEYLYSNQNYYEGYRYGSIKKKRKRLLQGALTPLGLIATGLILSLSLNN